MQSTKINSGINTNSGINRTPESQPNSTGLQHTLNATSTSTPTGLSSAIPTDTIANSNQTFSTQGKTTLLNNYVCIMKIVEAHLVTSDN